MTITSPVSWRSRHLFEKFTIATNEKDLWSPMAVPFSVSKDGLKKA